MLFTRYGALMGMMLVSSTSGYVLDSKCYSSPGSGVGKPVKDPFQSQSECRKTCARQRKLIFALRGGDTCFCSDDKPGSDEVVDKDQCSQPCNGFGDHICGGRNAYTIGYTGIDGGDTSDYPVPEEEDASSSTENSTTSTISGAPVIVTATGSETPTSEAQSGGSGPNKAGIAAGVVVGVILFIALCVGIFLTLRRRRRIQAEEEYRQAVSTKEFVSSIRKPDSDARLDPVILQQRRLSDGSIADNQDYSRRILKVTNPDNS